MADREGSLPSAATIKEITPEKQDRLRIKKQDSDHRSSPLPQIEPSDSCQNKTFQWLQYRAHCAWRQLVPGGHVLCDNLAYFRANATANCQLQSKPHRRRVPHPIHLLEN